MINLKTTILNNFLEFDFSELTLPMITVYENPSDFRGEFVARLFDYQNVTEFAIVGKTLDSVRKGIPEQFHRLNRMENDDPVIVEVWI